MITEQLNIYHNVIICNRYLLGTTLITSMPYTIFIMYSQINKYATVN